MDEAPWVWVWVQLLISILELRRRRLCTLVAFCWFVMTDEGCSSFFTLELDYRLTAWNIHATRRLTDVETVTGGGDTTNKNDPPQGRQAKGIASFSMSSMYIHSRLLEVSLPCRLDDLRRTYGVVKACAGSFLS